LWRARDTQTAREVAIKVLPAELAAEGVAVYDTGSKQEETVPVRLNITIDEDLYRRLKKELPAKGISSFIEAAVRARLFPDRRKLDTAYKAASKERWREGLTADWAATETEGWPR
jgi:predicted CopG family antitoxin